MSALLGQGKLLASDFVGQMEATLAQTLPFSTFINSERIERRQGLSVPVSRTSKGRGKLQALVSARSLIRSPSSRSRNVALEVSCSYKNFPGDL